jgi:hypothetical protein
LSVDVHNQQVLTRLKQRIGEDLAANMRITLIKKDIPAHIDPRDNIYDSINWHIDQEGNLLVGSDSPHAPYIEWGRDAGEAPPFSPIHEWVRVKLGKQEPEASQIAWAIVRKISARGVKPTRFMKISLEEFVREHNK